MEQGMADWKGTTNASQVNEKNPYNISSPLAPDSSYESSSSKCCCCPRSSFRSCKGFTIGKHALGVLLILCVTVIWVASSVWIQYIFGELDYEKPYLMTYFNTTMFALWNIGYIVRPSWRRVPWDNTEKVEPIVFTDPNYKAAYEEGGEFSSSSSLSQTDLENGKERVGVVVDNNAADEMAAKTRPNQHTAGGGNKESDALLSQKSKKKSGTLKPYSKLKILKCACAFCVFWFFANYLFNLSLSRTSVASNTVLSSTSSIWTFLLSVILLGHRVSIPKVFAVVLCIGGSVMIAFADGKDALKGDAVSGDILAILSAIFYALYTSVLKWYLPEDERFSTLMAFGMVGVVNMLTFWVGLPILNAVDFEPFQLPTIQQLWPLILNTLIGTNLSDVLWARSVVLTSPLVATLGLTLTTPLAMIVDLIWNHKKFSPLYIGGSVLVTMGFILVNLEGQVLSNCLRCLRLSPGRVSQQ